MYLCSFDPYLIHNNCKKKKLNTEKCSTLKDLKSQEIKFNFMLLCVAEKYKTI